MSVCKFRDRAERRQELRFNNQITLTYPLLTEDNERMSNVPATKHNWPEIFVAYCNGCPLDELAQVYGIDCAQLQTKASVEGWAKLRASIPQTAVVPVDKASAKLAIIEENRRENLKSWVDLRNQLVDVIGKLRKGELKFEKLFHSKGLITRDEIGPTTGDLVNITTAMRTIADGTYRALGDVTASEKGGQDAASGAAAPAITIILPGVIAAPRNQRTTDVQSEVIDLSNVKVIDKPPSSDSSNPEA